VGIAKEEGNLPSQGNLAIAMIMERTISQLVRKIVYEVVRNVLLPSHVQIQMILTDAISAYLHVHVNQVENFLLEQIARH
jgi:hypothetical protein